MRKIRKAPSSLRINRECPTCKKPFIATRKNTIYCSDYCRADAWAVKRKAGLRVQTETIKDVERLTKLVKGFTVLERITKDNIKKARAKKVLDKYSNQLYELLMKDTD